MANDEVSTHITEKTISNKGPTHITRKERGWQMAYIARTLKTNGYVTRNHALSLYITRLSDIIFKLRNAGWVIDGANDPKYNKFGEHIGTDYKYTLKKLPAEIA